MHHYFCLPRLISMIFIYYKVSYWTQYTPFIHSSSLPFIYLSSHSFSLPFILREVTGSLRAIPEGRGHSGWGLNFLTSYIYYLNKQEVPIKLSLKISLVVTVLLCILQTSNELSMCHELKDNRVSICKSTQHADHTWAWLLWYISNKVLSSCLVHPVISFYRPCSFHRWTSLQESLTSGVKNAFQSTTLYCLPYAYFMGGETAGWKWKRKHPLITSQWYPASLGHRTLLLVSIQGVDVKR